MLLEFIAGVLFVATKYNYYDWIYLNIYVASQSVCDNARIRQTFHCMFGLKLIVYGAQKTLHIMRYKM